MMGMMAQIITKLSDKGKEVEDSSSRSDQKMDLVKRKPAKIEKKKKLSCLRWTFLYSMEITPGNGLGEQTNTFRSMEWRKS